MFIRTPNKVVRLSPLSINSLTTDETPLRLSCSSASFFSIHSSRASSKPPGFVRYSVNSNTSGMRA